MPCIGNVPTIVASGSTSVASGPISMFTIFTPTAVGVFRVSFYYSRFTEGRGIVITWTDNTEPTGSPATPDKEADFSYGGGGGYISESQILLSDASAPIQIGVPDEASGGGLGGTLFYIVEQLA